MPLKIAINGFGRIGRCVSRLICEHLDVQLVAINDLNSTTMMQYLLENDSVHGQFLHSVELMSENCLKIGSQEVHVIHESNPQKVDFASLGADVVIECSGMFLTQKEAQHHIEKGIKRVIFSAPAADDETATFVIGVNEHLYSGQKIISNASCTTNCLGHVAKILDDNFGIDKGLVTTIHAYTNDQNLLDATHKSDPRRSRAAAVNMIPTYTGAAKAMKLVLPSLDGKLHGQSVRVPTPDVSMVDFNVVINKNTTKEELSELFTDESQNRLKNIIEVDKKMRVSQDFVNSPMSAIIADDLTQVIDGNLVKIMAWYDNEWGYSNRLIEMALHIVNEE
ncbi:MAG: type I glyceraldehyde-3-phosphate dehydrogenase [Campylobacterota bacterium]|nr:type I glyceraldehyde-3-phosphate dehydrogenase [Campylobacterota bacterium]